MKTFTLSYHVKIVGRCLITGLLLVVLFQSAVMAQYTSLYKGDRVRISAPDIYPETVRGTVYGINSTQIILELKEGLQIFPLNSIDRLDISYSEKRHTLLGAITGLLGGALIGGSSAASNYKECDSNELFGCAFYFDKKASTQLGAIGGGLIGVVAGTFIGFIIKTDRWENLPLEASMDFQSLPAQKLSFSPVFSLKFPISGDR